MTVRVRFAPSPTGFMHLGNARTALFNWLFARHHGGTFLLRIEDTDRERSTEAAVQVIFDSLKWLGLDWEEEVLFQSQRLPLYHGIAEELIAKGAAYRCNCTREALEIKKEEMRLRVGRSCYDRTCRDKNLGPDCGEHVVRFKMPLEGPTSFDDCVQGCINKNYEELDDFVMLRTDGMPTYQFAVVVDDRAMAITHVIRGVDHIDNTHEQVALYQALGATPPRFAHAPRILGLSKRKGSPSLEYYRDAMGLSPEGLINYIVRLGWSSGDQEIFSVAEIVERFDLPGVNRANGNFDEVKLAWVNEQHLRLIPIERLATLTLPFYAELGLSPEVNPWFLKLLELMRVRAHDLREIATASRFFFVEPESYDPEAAKKHLSAPLIAPLEDLATAIESLDAWTEEAIQAVFAQVCAAHGLKLGKIAQPARIAMTGVAQAPGIYEIAWFLGPKTTAARLRRAAQWISASANA